MAPKKLQIPLPFEQIMQRHEREILRYLMRVLGNGADAADLFQETWLRAYRAYPRLEPDSKIRPWLYAIALNLCRNRTRDGARRARVIVAAEEKNSAEERIGNDHRGFSENEGYAAVRMRELIASLPPKQREALHLRCFAGLNYTEIAAAMDCSEQGARANVSQAIRKIKSMW
jgi:RNA polymerase sigma-70 factor (ECF subfamily)